jgi:hypothetical protein
MTKNPPTMASEKVNIPDLDDLIADAHSDGRLASSSRKVASVGKAKTVSAAATAKKKDDVGGVEVDSEMEDEGEVLEKVVVKKRKAAAVKQVKVKKVKAEVKEEERGVEMEA